MNGKAPGIGLSSRICDDAKHHQLRQAYVAAVLRAGGIPWIIPSISKFDILDDLVERLDGLILTGGEDIEPRWFGQRPHERLAAVDPIRDAFEIRLAQKWLASGKPLLGICRGLQVLNVAAGGTLFQDIQSCLPDAINHKPGGARSTLVHEIVLSPESILHGLLSGKTKIPVNSIHHQSVDTVAPGFFVAATSLDGVVEAMESRAHPCVLGVQWHPEDMLDVGQIRIFKHLCDHSRGIRESLTQPSSTHA